MAVSFGVQSFCNIKKKEIFPKKILSCLLSFLLSFLLNSILIILVVRIISRKIRKKEKKKYPKLEDQQNHKNNHQYLQFQLPISTNSSKNVAADEDERNIPPQFDHNLQHFQHYFLQQHQQQEHQPLTIREHYSQLDTQNYGPISENNPVVKKRAFGNANEQCPQHVRQKSAMVVEEVEQQQQQLPVPVSTRSALRRAGVGEIVEVQGGHIVRATGRKDRHSKVCTAKGPRDRRVRLSAHTAIQFYDVQDRLGYDRPSKAVDWLIKKAKSAIDELEQLPAWSPTSVSLPSVTRRRGKASEKMNELVERNVGASGSGGGGDQMYVDEQQQQNNSDEQQQHMYNDASNSLLPPSLDSDSIADTIKSFFPMGGAAAAATSSALDYSHHGGGGGGMRHSQDLRLSLQSFQVQDPILMHSHQQHDEQQHQHQHSVFPGAAPIGYENPNAGWADSQNQPSPELGRLHRMMVGWHSHNHQQSSSTDQQQHHSGSGNVVGLSGAGAAGSASGGYMFNQPPLLQPLFGGQHSQFFTQRGPLQSSNTPSIRAWISDPSIASSNSDYHQAIPVHPQVLSGLGYPSGGFSGFHFPTRIQGEEEHDGDPNKPSSASSGSRH